MNMGRYADKNQALVDIDATRQALAGLGRGRLARADGQGAQPALHPQKNFLEGHRYVVAFRNLKTTRAS